MLKTLLLRVVYLLVQPTGPLASRQGPLDAQCKLVQTMIYTSYENADLSIAVSILESTGTDIKKTAFICFSCLIFMYFAFVCFFYIHHNVEYVF